MKKIFVSLLIALVFALLTIPVLALQTEPPAPPTLDAAWAIFISLIGWPAFLVAAVNLLKIVKVIPDGYAGSVSYIVNAAFFVLVAYLVFTGKLEVLTGLDAALGKVAVLIGNIIVILGGFTISEAVKKFTYEKVKGTPLIGYSHTKP